MEGKQVKFVADSDVAEHLAKQPNQRAYMQRLIRNDMGASESLEARVERLEQRFQQMIDEQNAEWARKHHIMTPQFKAEKKKIVRK